VGAAHSPFIRHCCCALVIFILITLFLKFFSIRSMSLGSLVSITVIANRENSVKRAGFRPHDFTPHVIVFSIFFMIAIFSIFILDEVNEVI